MSMTEDNEQKAIITWARWQPVALIGLAGVIADYLHHSPNGGARTAREGKKFKQMGTLSGFPDLFLFIPRGGYHGLFIELKTPKGKTATGKTRQAGRLQETQEVMLNRLDKAGYKAVVCYGANNAIEEIKNYLGV